MEENDAYNFSQRGFFHDLRGDFLYLYNSRLSLIGDAYRTSGGGLMPLEWCAISLAISAYDQFSRCDDISHHMLYFLFSVWSPCYCLSRSCFFLIVLFIFDLFFHHTDDCLLIFFSNWKQDGNVDTFFYLLLFFYILFWFAFIFFCVFLHPNLTVNWLLNRWQTLCYFYTL